MTGPRKQKTGDRRGGFTLIELMIVIVIIALLIGLLVPAVAGAISKTRIAGVKTEISNLETAIAKFKIDHGIEPPSFITLHESPADWTADVNNKSLIRQLWPQFNFALGRDLNGNGTIDTGTAGTYRLAGSECLVFFLGGMFVRDAGSGIFSMSGFSKNPADPFSLALGSREAPLFEFRPERLKDFDGDGIPEYFDALPSQRKPYLYYSSNYGQGYNPAEFLTSPPTPPISYGLYVPYRQGITLTAPVWNGNTCQIVSPGYDGEYGYGGAYLTTGADALPVGPTPTALAGIRSQEADNITNFSLSVLKP